MVIDIHLRAALQLVHLALHCLQLVLRCLIVESGVDFVMLVGVEPRVFVEK
jgi:hypothetical protein